MKKSLPIIVVLSFTLALAAARAFSGPTSPPGTGGNNAFNISATGRIGIGESNPQEAFDVAGNVKATAFIGELATSVSAGRVTGGSVIFGANTSSTASYAFPGKLGITTSSLNNLGPAALSVFGDATIFDTVLGRGEVKSENASKPLVLQPSSGLKVGIRVANPAHTLDVAGAIKMADEGARPACDGVRQGMFWFGAGEGAGGADVFQVCAYDGTGWGWRTIY